VVCFYGRYITHEKKNAQEEEEECNPTTQALILVVSREKLQDDE
jgi:hypothetical protein